MAERVVDDLELVEVDEDDRECLARALGAGQGVREAVLEQDAVGEAGKGVVQGLVAQLVLGALTLDGAAEDVADRLQEVDVVVVEAVRLGGVRGEHAEGLTVGVGDDHAHAADDSVGAQLGGVQARLVGDVADDDGNAGREGEAGLGQGAAHAALVAPAGGGDLMKLAGAGEVLQQAGEGDVEALGGALDGGDEEILDRRAGEGEGAERGDLRLLGGAATGVELALAALADVLHLGDQVEQLAVGVVDGRDAQRHPDVTAVGVQVALLAADRRDRAVDEGVEGLIAALDVIGVGDVREPAADQLVLGVAEHVAQGAVDLDPLPVGAGEGHADR